ncbi:MAG TPA: NUDIX domain-containing protein [Nostocaceae cyanobacterium]|nr:NUDIX domain-containing protein [Nostocaceae cyanobacterium]
MTQQKVRVAIAILYQNDKYLMQLRDNIPNIAHPGCWGLFGGHIEHNEEEEIALQREILEETGYQLPSFAKFGDYDSNNVIHHVYQAPLLVEIDQLVLGEGWDMGLLTSADIRRGNCYSAIAGEARPIGDIHHIIMLDFINQK